MIMKLIKPISEERRRQLEEELELQKKRFSEATQSTSDALTKSLSVLDWFRRHPRELAAVSFATGLLAAQYLNRIDSR
jgi:hypothetical protein